MAVVRQGRRYRLGRTEVYGGIWRRRPWGWRLVARYPLTGEGWHIAEGQFSLWEPEVGTGPIGSALGEDAPLGGTVVQTSRRRLGAFGWTAIALAVLVLAGAGVLTEHFVAEKNLPAASKTTGTNTKTTYERPPVGGGWLAHGQSWVVFIQWSSTRGSFDGTAQDVSLSGSPPTLKLTTTSVGVSGTIRANRITLTFEGHPEQFGTITTGRFTVNFPQSDGTLTPITFVATSAADYNHVIDALRSRVTSVNVKAQEAEAKANAETSINKSATAVLSDLKALSTEQTSLGQAVTGVKVALATETAVLATTRSASSSVSSCDTANSVGYDANSVGYGANSVGYAVSTVTREITAIHSGISTLRTAVVALQAKENALPGYTPLEQPTSAAVTKAVAQAQAAIAAAVSATNGYITQANADVKVAGTIARQAEHSQGCSTTTLGAFTQVATITS